MNRRLEGWPDVARSDVGTVVITIRHTDGPEHQKELAAVAEAERQKEVWPRGLLGWALFTGTDGRALLAYEQWSDDDALDTAIAGRVPYVPGIPGTEPAAPVRYRLERSYPGGAPGQTAGCLVTPVFDTDGPERQRHFLDTLFAMAGDDATRDVGQMPGALSAYFHISADGTRVLGYAEWTDEAAHLAAVGAPDTAASRQRLTGEIPGVRPSGHHRWHLHTALARS
ncbi:antibiotic biosynthesis monooxygenase [Streptomyces ipomoeae]|uniref:antibiotic biosynthesis monooxygenase n=1 Tax=Streptomyces ipomoeae TaxID=103232 RepID=UPI0011467BBF|nr:antibiotic biosynthesis monooxygenase [Streptomyces ipomoeae]MDX2938466.1 antibiotic biosynthesis monooxygenase [Streptomyces ipomoeae]TQE17100.1 hypothetical protein SipoB123_37610 [Streptomyces ipomoeae]